MSTQLTSSENSSLSPHNSQTVVVVTNVTINDRKNKSDDESDVPRILPDSALIKKCVTEERVNQIIEGIKHFTTGRTVTPALLIRIVANVMILSDGMNIPNKMKKKVVTSAFEKILENNSNLGRDELDILMAFIEGELSELIDSYHKSKNNKLEFSKKKTNSCCVVM